LFWDLLAKKGLLASPPAREHGSRHIPIVQIIEVLLKFLSAGTWSTLSWLSHWYWVLTLSVISAIPLGILGKVRSRQDGGWNRIEKMSGAGWRGEVELDRRKIGGEGDGSNSVRKIRYVTVPYTVDTIQ